MCPQSSRAARPLGEVAWGLARAARRESSRAPPQSSASTSSAGTSDVALPVRPAAAERAAICLEAEVGGAGRKLGNCRAAEPGEEGRTAQRCKRVSTCKCMSTGKGSLEYPLRAPPHVCTSANSELTDSGSAAASPAVQQCFSKQSISSSVHSRTSRRPCGSNLPRRPPCAARTLAGPLPRSA